MKRNDGFTYRSLQQVLRYCIASVAAATLLLLLGIPGLNSVTKSARAESAGGVDGPSRQVAGTLDLGLESTCSVRPHGGVRCFGVDTWGQVGDSTLTSDGSHLGGIAASNVSSDDALSCAVRTDGALRCWGYNAPNLGPGSATAVSVNGLGACFVTPAGTLRCMNSFPWGFGVVSNASTDVPFTNLPAGATVVAVSSYAATECALFSTGGVRCAGRVDTEPSVIAGSSLSQDIPGLPPMAAIANGGGTACGVSTTGDVHCWGRFGPVMGPIGTPIPLSGPAIAVANNGQTACALGTNGGVSCWGDGYTPGLPTPIPLGPDRNGSPAVAINVAIARYHTCVTLTTFEVRCWGQTNLLGGSSLSVSVPFIDPPETTINSGPVAGSTVYSNTQSLTFSAQLPTGATFECSLDSGPFTACVSPVTLSGMGNGPHTYEVRALNAGGTDSTPASRSWTVDAGDAFRPVPVTRILDTRQSVRMGVGETRNFSVVGAAGVPANASAVALNVAVVNPGASGHLRVFPAGEPLPNASVLNFFAGKNTPNHVIVKVGSGGQVSLYAGDATDVIVDINGYFEAGSGGGYTPVPTPTRIFDDSPPAAGPTRQITLPPVVAGAPELSTVTVPVLGFGGIPATGPVTVALNIGAVNPGATGHLRVYPTGEASPPLASTHNFVAGDSRVNLVLVNPGVGGAVDIYNASSGPVTLTVDTVGWFRSSTEPGGQTFKPITPVRPLDTREGAGAIPLAAGESVDVQIRGFGGVPSGVNVKSVAVNIAAVNPSAVGSIVVGPSGATPVLPWLRHPANENVANLAIVPVGDDGKIRLVNNSAGTTHLIVDITGYFVADVP
jgi:hypothetical protein